MDDEHSLIQQALVLRRVERGQKVARFYALMVERDLFGETVVIRHWGWIGTRGRERMDAHPDETAAAGALAKLAALKRRGYRDL